jgi:hypothetical protein
MSVLSLFTSPERAEILSRKTLLCFFVITYKISLPGAADG